MTNRLIMKAEENMTNRLIMNAEHMTRRLVDESISHCAAVAPLRNVLVHRKNK